MSEFFFLFIPHRNFLPNSETEQQCLIWQRNRRAPFHSEGSEIGYGCDPTGLHVGRNSSLSREFDEFLVFRGEIGKRGLVCAANHRYHNPVLRFNCDTQVDRF